MNAMIIGFRLGFWHDDHFKHITAGALDYAKKHPHIKLYLPDTDIFFPQQVPSAVNGILAKANSSAQHFNANAAPVVYIGGSVGSASGVHVITENRAIARMAFEHFRSLGLWHLAVLDSARFRGARCKPFLETCRENGFIPYVFRYGGRHVIESSEARHKRLSRQLRSLPKPASLFLTADDHYPAIIQLCSELDIRVPRDLAILGINNNSTYCFGSKPPLSSIDPDGERIGYAAMETLVAMINGKPVPNEIPIQPKEIIARDSTKFILDEHQYVTRVLDYMHANLAEPLEVEDLVGQQDLGRRALKKRFKKVCGESLNQHLISVRMQKIRHLLETTKLTVVEIGRRCGLPDSSYMDLIFRKRHGMTPLHYRRVYQTTVPETPYKPKLLPAVPKLSEQDDLFVQFRCFLQETLHALVFFAPFSDGLQHVHRYVETLALSPNFFGQDVRDVFLPRAHLQFGLPQVTPIRVREPWMTRYT